MGEVGFWQIEDAVALFHDSCLTRDASTLDVAAVGGVFNGGSLGCIFTACRALYPRRDVEGEDIRSCSLLDADGAVACFAHDDVLSIERTADGAAILHLLAVGHDEWWWRNGDVFHLTQIIAGVRRLVVATHLPHHRVAILMVVPEGVDAILRRCRRGIDADAVVGSAHDDFLAPVAKNVALIARGAFRVVVGEGTCTCVDRCPTTIFRHASLRVLSVDIVEGFGTKVAIPVDAEVGVHTCGGESVNRVVIYQTDGSFTRGTSQSAREIVAEVACNGTSIVSTGVVAVVDFAGGGITIVVARLVLVAGIDFLSVDIWVEVAAMLGVAMSETRSGKSFSVVVDDHRTKHDFVASVPIHIGNAVVVVALTFPRAIGIVVPTPTFHQLVGSRVHIVGNHLVAGVDATCEEDAWLAPIEVWRSEEILAGTMSVAVAPSSVEVVFATFQSQQWIGDTLIWLSCFAIHIDQVLSTVVHEPVGAATCSGTVVETGTTNGEDGAIGLMDGGAVGSANHHFGFAIAIPVVAHDIDFVVLEIAHVRTAIDPPQHGAIELQALQKGVFMSDLPIDGRSILGIALSHFTLIVVLQEDFQFSISIHIGTTSIVGHVGAQEGCIVLGIDFHVAG